MEDVPIKETPMDSTSDDASSDGEIEVMPDNSVDTFDLHTDSVFSIAASHIEKNVLCTGGADEVGYIFDPFTHEVRSKLEGHTDSLSCVRFSYDGTLCATGSMDHTVKIWKSASGAPVHDLEGAQEAVNWIDWHPRGPILLAGCHDGSTWMWNADNGQFMSLFSGHSGPVSCGGFTPDGKGIITASEDGSIRAYDPRTGASVCSFKDGVFHRHGITALKVSGDSRNFLSVSGDAEGHVRGILLETQKLAFGFDSHTDSIEAIDFCPVMPLLLTASTDASVQILDIETGQARCAFAHGGPVTRAQFAPGSHVVVSSSADGVVRVLDSREAQPVAELRGHETVINDFCFLGASGQHVMTAGDDGECRLFMVGS